MPVAGLSGAAALDAQGRVLGMMAMRNAVLASVGAGGGSPVRLVGAGTIRDFLSRASRGARRERKTATRASCRAGDLRAEVTAYLFFHSGLRFSTKAFMPSF